MAQTTLARLGWTVAGLLIAAPSIVGLALGMPSGLSAQTVLLDEGTFRHLREGREVGTETFTIHRIGLGADAEFLATGTVQIDGLQMRPALKAAVDQSPASYQNTLSGRRTAQLSIVRNGPRFESRTISSQGESQREYRGSASTAILETGVAHHWFFVARGLTEPGARRLVIRPADATQGVLLFTGRTRENTRLGREVLSATRLDFELDGQTGRLWVDDEGRVLRVQADDASWSAERVPTY